MRDRIKREMSYVIDKEEPICFMAVTMTKCSERGDIVPTITFINDEIPIESEVGKAIRDRLHEIGQLLKP